MGVVDVDFMITDVSEEGENSKKKGQQCFYISLYFPLSVNLSQQKRTIWGGNGWFLTGKRKQISTTTKKHHKIKINIHTTSLFEKLWFLKK